MMKPSKLRSALAGLRPFAPAIVRIAMALVFLWFGTSQIINPSAWTFYLPAWIGGLAAPETIIMLNGTFEIILGLLLGLGFLVRISALLLGLHLAGIAITVGYNPTGIRDLGLSIATLSVFFQGEDRLCLANLIRKRRQGR